MSAYLQQYSIFEGDDPRLFPTPLRYVQGRGVTDDTDFEAIKKEYLSSYKSYLKDSDVPDWERTMLAGRLSEDFFDNVLGLEDFTNRYNTRINPQAAAQVDEANAPKEPEQDGIVRSVAKGVVDSAGSTLTGVNALGKAIGQKTGVGNGMIMWGDGDFIPTWVPADQLQIMRDLDPKAFGADVEILRRAGAAVSGTVEADNPNRFAHSIGSAAGTLATGGAAGAITKSGLRTAGVVAGQSASQLAGEGVADYENTLQLRGEFTDPETQANVALLNSSLAAIDLFPGGSVARAVGLQRIDGITGGFVSKIANPGGFVKETTRGAVSEGLQEATQNTLSNLIASDVIEYDKERSMFVGTQEAGEGGAAAGAFMTAVLYGLGSRRSSGSAPQEPNPLTDTAEATGFSDAQRPPNATASRQNDPLSTSFSSQNVEAEPSLFEQRGAQASDLEKGAQFVKETEAASKPQEATQPSPDAPVNMTDVVSQIIGNESSGKADAKNPLSSATGLGQFIDSTWLATIKKHRPDVAEGRSDSEILALRTDAELSREMTTRYAEDNAAALERMGHSATPTNIYLAHHFGEGGADKLLKADRSASVESVMGSKVIEQNPKYKNKSVDWLLARIDKQMGGEGRASVPVSQTAEPVQTATVSEPFVANQDTDATQGVVSDDADSTDSGVATVNPPPVSAEPAVTVDSSIDTAVAEHDLPSTTETALYEVYGSVNMKNPKAAERRLRQYFTDNYDGSESSSRVFVSKRMGELRSAGVLDTMNNAYFNSEESGARLHLRDRSSSSSMAQDKSVAAIQRVMGSVPFETSIPDTINVEGKTVLGAVQNGKVYFNTNNFTSVAEAEATAIEELTHLGTAKLLGDQYTEKLTKFHSAIGGEKGIKKFLNKNDVQMDDSYFSQSPEAQVDELLAHVAASPQSLTTRAKRAFQQLVGFVRDRIRSFNTTALHNVTDSDVVYFASRVKKAGQNIAADPDVTVPDTELRTGVRAREPEGANRDKDAREIQARLARQRNKPLNAERVIQGYETLGEKREKMWNKFFGSESQFIRQKRRALMRTFGTNAGLSSIVAEKQGVEQKDAIKDSRDVAELRRNLDRDTSAIHAAIENDVTTLHAAIKAEYGVNANDLTIEQQAEISERIKGNDPDGRFSYFTERISAMSTLLTNRLVVEQNMHVKRVQKMGLGLEMEANRDLINDPDYEVNKLPPHLRRIATLQRQVNTIQGNMGSYLHRSYNAFTDKNWIDKVKLTPAYNNAIAYIKEDKGISREDATTQVNEILESTRDKDNALQMAMSGKKDHGMLSRRKGIPVEIQELLGVIKDPVYNFAVSMDNISNFVSSHVYQTELRDTGVRIGLFSETPQGETVQEFSSDEGWSVMQGVYMDQDTKLALDALGGLEPVQGAPAYEALIKAGSAVKFAKTVLSPTTAMRNLISGSILLLSTGHLPFSNAKEAIKLMAQSKNSLGIGGRIKNAASKDGEGSLFLSDREAREMRDKLIRLGVMNDGAKSGELIELFNDVRTADKLFRSKGAVGKVLDGATAFYRFGDDFYKIIHFLSERSALEKSSFARDEGKTKEEREAALDIEAGKRTRDMMPTYSMIPRGMKQLRRFPAAGTFVSFPWEVVRTMGNQLRYFNEDRQSGDPVRRAMAIKKLAGFAAAQSAIGSAFGVAAMMAKLGLEDADDDHVDEGSPDWAKGMQRLYLSNENGRIQYTNMSALIPSDYIYRAFRNGMHTGDVEGFWSGAWEGAKQLSGPFIGADITWQAINDFIRNEDSGTGYPIYGHGKTIEDLTNVDTLTQGTAYLLRKIGPGVIQNADDFIRANSTTQGEDDATWVDAIAASRGGKLSRSGKEFTNADAFAALMGFRVTTLNMDHQSASISKQSKQMLRDAKANLRSALDQTTAISPEDVQARLDEFLNERDKAYGKALRAVEYQRNRGKTPAEIQKLLYLKGQGSLNKEEIRALVARGRPEPYRIDRDEITSLTKRAFRTLEQFDPATQHQTKKELIQRLREADRYLADKQRP